MQQQQCIEPHPDIHWVCMHEHVCACVLFVSCVVCSALVHVLLSLLARCQTAGIGCVLTDCPASQLQVLAASSHVQNKMAVLPCEQWSADPGLPVALCSD
jgi:hypothetical protein